jgi:hypothetical protein
MLSFILPALVIIHHRVLMYYYRYLPTYLCEWGRYLLGKCYAEGVPLVFEGLEVAGGN